MEKSVQIGRNIRKKREERMWFQAELAQKLDVSPQTISSWESGRTEPKYYMLEKMATLFGCSPYDLAGIVPMTDMLADNAEKAGEVLEDDEKEFLDAYRKASSAAKLKAYAELIRGGM